MLPEPPYFVINKRCGRCLALGGDGSYDACLSLLGELERAFGARASVHLESGHCPGADKEKGYWNIEMFGEDFFLMRHRGFGICLWGPSPPAAVAGFLRVAAHFDAREHLSFFGRLAKRLRLSGRSGSASAAGDRNSFRP